MPEKGPLSGFLALCLVLSAAPGFSQSLKNMAHQSASLLLSPIRNPKSAFAYWFNFDPKVESGEKKNFNVLPLFVSSPERGIGFGLQFAEKSLYKKDDVVHVQAIQTLKEKSSYRMKYEFPPMPSWIGPVGAEFETGYENYQQFYYGIGNGALQEDESGFTPEFFDARLPLLYALNSKTFLGVSFNFENWKIVQTDERGILPHDLPTLIGKDGSRLYTTGLLLRWDSRDSKTNPTEGVFLENDLEYSKKLLGGENDFTRAVLEARGYHPAFGREDQVFALRLYMDYVNGDAPFYRLPQLGGIYFTRGLIEGRFRDNLALCGNWEYRLRIYQRLHWAFFVDTGDVFHGFESVNYHTAKVTGGTGMRYYVPPGDLLLARVDLGYSTEGMHVYLTFDQPF